MLGHVGIDIGLSEYRTPLTLGQLLLLPLRGSDGRYTYAGLRPARAQGGRRGMKARALRIGLVGLLAVGIGLTPHQVHTLLSHDAPPLVLDVHSPEEFVGELGHIGGALLLPLPALDNRLAEITPPADHRHGLNGRGPLRKSGRVAAGTRLSLGPSDRIP